ncbi:MAG: aminotransferase class V-fold PLP-dependent enzyme [Fusobacteriaceae bacterium]|jgi:cysteine desulfurase family protein|nr:aminotransferase class V-fold PLP-dependent enzyme [Fusobacteriaceae bacterium]
MIYLDNASTTYPKPEELYIELDKINRELAFNSGRGSYRKAREVSILIDEVREKISSMVMANKDNVIFTSSATEALNNIIFGIKWNIGDNVYISPFEHNSLVRPLERIKKLYNINIHIIPFDKKSWNVKDEIFDMFALKNPKYIFLSSKSNVTGYRLPFEKIFELGKKYNSINLLDASQSFGIDKTITKNYIDFIVFAGHKSLYATFGVAGFIKLTNISLDSRSFGGTGSDTLNPNMPDVSPTKYEAGSKNTIGILGLKVSLEWLEKANINDKEKELTKYLYENLLKLSKIIICLPEDKEKISGIISINIDGYISEDVGKILDEEFDICVRTGYHCSPYIHDFLETKKYYGTVRISLGYFNNFSDIDKLIIALKSL